MDRTVFMKALSARLYPLLRKEGFRGSGSTLRRVNEPVVHVFQVQASSSGAACYLDLGAHLTFLPKPGDGQPDAKTLKEYECAFRDRLDPPTGSGSGWAYGRNENEMNEAVAAICDYWPLYGRPFFDRYSRFPEDFVPLVEDVDASAVHPNQLLTLARIAARLHKNARARSFAEEALRRCSERATSLRATLNEFVDELPKD